MKTTIRMSKRMKKGMKETLAFLNRLVRNASFTFLDATTTTTTTTTTTMTMSVEIQRNFV
jgi:hypothetical protein